MHFQQLRLWLLDVAHARRFQSERFLEPPRSKSMSSIFESPTQIILTLRLLWSSHDTSRRPQNHISISTRIREWRERKNMWPRRCVDRMSWQAVSATRENIGSVWSYVNRFSHCMCIGTYPGYSSTLAKAIPNFRLFDVNFDNEPQLRLYQGKNRNNEFRWQRWGRGMSGNKTKHIMWRWGVFLASSKSLASFSGFQIHFPHVDR